MASKCRGSVVHSARPVRTEIGLGPDELLVGAYRQHPRAQGLRSAARLRSSRAQKRKTRCRFVIAGDTSGSHYEKLLEQRARLGLESSVQFLGLRKDVPDVLASLTCTSCSSSKRRVLDCLRRGDGSRPCSGRHRSGGLEEIVEDGQHGPAGSTARSGRTGRGHRIPCIESGTARPDGASWAGAGTPALYNRQQPARVSRSAAIDLQITTRILVP